MKPHSGDLSPDTRNRLQEPEERRDRIRFRAILLGLVLSILICAMTPFNNVYRQATPLGGGYFPLAPFYALLFLTLFAATLRKLFTGWNWLTGKEMLTVWILMVIDTNF